jgi:NADPH:quinone reductase-like Zn-dependent oxidoreductase
MLLESNDFIESAISMKEVVMRSVRFATFADDPAAVLTVEEVARPEPGPQELLIRLTARPINGADFGLVRGSYDASLPRPATPGFEGVGVIEAVGSSVGSLRAGQRVVPLGARGTWQDYITINAAQALPIPQSIADIQASMLAINPATAWVMLTEALPTQPGDWVLQTAAGSAIGAWITAIARKQGYKTIGVVRRRDQIDRVRAQGADEVICLPEDDLERRVHAITAGRGVPYVLDPVGGQLGARLLALLARGGTLISYAVLSHELISVDTRRMFSEDLTLRGFSLRHWLPRATPARIGEIFGTLIRMLAERQVEVAVEATYDLANVRSAMAHAARTGRAGKIILTS